MATSDSITLRIRKIVVFQFEYIKPKNKCHVPQCGHPEQPNWILDELSIYES